MAGGADNGATDSLHQRDAAVAAARAIGAARHRCLRRLDAT